MTPLPKGTTVETTNRQPGELINMDFDFYNVTYIQVLTPMLTLFCAKTRMLWVFPTASIIPTVRIILFILTTLENEHHT